MNDIIEFDQKAVQMFRQANALVEAVYPATLTEKRILATMISMIKPEHSDFKDYKIDIKKFAEVFDIKGKSVLDLVKKSTESLLSRTIKINDGDKFLQINWISSAEYQKGSSDVIIRFDPKLKPYLLNLRGEYTTALLDQVAKFKSVYAFRLYELFKQYSPNIGVRKFDLAKLKSLMACENEYPSYANFKDKVINRAVYEINQLSDLNITFLELKEGRKVNKIEFTIALREGSKKVIDGIKVVGSSTSTSTRDLENITSYFLEKGYKSNAEKFFLNGEKKKWRGIANWQAAADEWELNHKEMFPDKHKPTDTNVGQLKTESEEEKEARLKKEEDHQQRLENFKPTWQEIHQVLKHEAPAEYEKWMQQLEVFSVTEQEIIINTPSKFVRDWVIREFIEQKKGVDLRQVIEKVSGIKKVSIIYLG